MKQKCEDGNRCQRCLKLMYKREAQLYQKMRDDLFIDATWSQPAAARLVTTTKDSIQSLLNQRVKIGRAYRRWKRHGRFMTQNQVELLKEDLECVHKYLDDVGAPRSDELGVEYSIVGRIQHWKLKLGSGDSRGAPTRGDALTVSGLRSASPESNFIRDCHLCKHSFNDNKQCAERHGTDCGEERKYFEPRDPPTSCDGCVSFVDSAVCSRSKGAECGTRVGVFPYYEPTG